MGNGLYLPLSGFTARDVPLPGKVAFIDLNKAERPPRGSITGAFIL
jgi:hypothetical protein